MPVTVRPLLIPNAAVVETNGSVDIPVEANDDGQFGPTTITVPPLHGNAEVTNSIRYTPDPDYVGTDLITYQLCAVTDPSVCDSTLVYISVRLVATEDGAGTTAGRPVTTYVLANDLIGPGTAITIRTNPVNGTVVSARTTPSPTPRPETSPASTPTPTRPAPRRAARTARRRRSRWSSCRR